ncbi:MAG: hypothetical protein J0L82_10310 [Deltaproteobacteria bacterium]|jgi:hypothetical protein|nr:hypothetical protein [Deltaproteobacteria bacterium]
MSLGKSNRLVRRIAIGVVLSVLGTLLSACGSAVKNDTARLHPSERVLIESSLGGEKRPVWLETTAVFEDDGTNLRFIGRYSGLGSDRIPTCYRLAEADIQVRIAQEVRNQVKAELVQMAEGLDERLDAAVLDSILIESAAEVRGVRVADRYHERALVNGVERVDCFARSQVSRAEFMRLKNGTREDVASRNPELKKLLTKRQKQFLDVQAEAVSE